MYPGKAERRSHCFVNKADIRKWNVWLGKVTFYLSTCEGVILNEDEAR